MPERSGAAACTRDDDNATMRPHVGVEALRDVDDDSDEDAMSTRCVATQSPDNSIILLWRSAAFHTLIVVCIRDEWMTFRAQCWHPRLCKRLYTAFAVGLAVGV